MYLSGMTYREVAEELGISERTIRTRGMKDKWSRQRDKVETKTRQKVDETIAVKAAQNAAEVLEPLRQASTTLVNKTLELMPEIERASDIRAIAGAVKDLSQVIRELHGILTLKEQNELELNRERIALEKERLQKDSAQPDTEVKFIIEYEADD